MFFHVSLVYKFTESNGVLLQTAEVEATSQEEALGKLYLKTKSNNGKMLFLSDVSQPYNKDTEEEAKAEALNLMADMLNELRDFSIEAGSSFALRMAAYLSKHSKVG